MGYKTVEASLIPSARTANNDVNKLKIVKYVNAKRYRVAEVRDKGFARVELRFDNLVEANKCLDDKEGLEKKIVDFNIPRENVQCKGVVSGWDTVRSLNDFADAKGESVRVTRI